MKSLYVVGLLLAALSTIAGEVITIAHDPGGTTAGSKDKGFTYGLRFTSPWKEGGWITLNFPEHLTYKPHQAGILRWHDKRDANPWKIAPDKATATLEVESSTASGIHCNAEARAEGDRIKLRWTLTNKTAATLTDIRALFCCFYRKLTGFPRCEEGLTFVKALKDDKWVALQEFKSEKPDSKVRFLNSKTALRKQHSTFAGGYAEDLLDTNLLVVLAKDSPRKLVLHWTPEGVVLSNASNACMHSDPCFPDIAAGQSAEAKGLIWFTEDSLEEILKKYKAGALNP